MNELPGVIVRKLVLRISLRILLIVALILFLALLFPPLLNLFFPFVLAFIVASALAPVIRRISKKMGKLWNFWSFFFILLLILAITGLLIYLGYYLFSQISDFIGNWSSIQQGMTEMIKNFSNFLDSNFRLSFTELEDMLLDVVQKGLNWLTDAISTWAPTVVSSVGSIASGIASFVIALLFFIVGAYFMTSDYPTLRGKISKAIPGIIRPHMMHVREAMNSAMFGYLRSQLILSGIVGVVIFLALLIWGQNYSLLIAIACAIIDIIPFFGSGTVLVPWAVITLILGDFRKAIFLLCIAFVLFLFRKLAEPKIMGNQTGLSPLLSLISIYVGMKLGGVLGMILCPICCMIIIGLYDMHFFDPTIQDFKMLAKHIIASATLRSKSSE